jgi:hypothetical protein
MLIQQHVADHVPVISFVLVQWAATRHDLFAHDVCEALEKLHTQAPAHSYR